MAAASDADGVGGSDSSGIRGHSRQAAFASPSPQERRAADSSVMRRFYPSLPAEQSDACLFSQQTAVPSASPARGPTQADASGVHTSQQPRSSYVASCGNWSDLDFSSVVWTRPQPASPRMSTLGGNASHPSSSSPFPSPLRGFCSCLKRIRRRVFSCTLKTHSECAWPSRRLNVWLSRLGDRVAFYIVEHPDFFLKRAGVCGVLLFLLTLVSAGISFGVPYLDPNETLRVDLEKAGCASATTPSSLSVFFEGNTTALPGHVGRLGGVDRLLSETGSRQDAADQSAPHSVLPEALHTQNALVTETALPLSDASSSLSGSGTTLAPLSPAASLRPSSASSSHDSGGHANLLAAFFSPSSSLGALQLFPPWASSDNTGTAEPDVRLVNTTTPLPSSAVTSSLPSVFPAQGVSPAASGGVDREAQASALSVDAAEPGCCGDIRTPARCRDTGGPASGDSWGRRVLEWLAEALQVRYVAGASLFLPQTGEARQKGEKMKQLFGEDRRLTTLLYVNEEAMHRRREERAEIGGRLEKARDEEDAGTREDVRQGTSLPVSRRTRKVVVETGKATDVASRRERRRDSESASWSLVGESQNAMSGSSQRCRGTEGAVNASLPEVAPDVSSVAYPLSPPNTETPVDISDSRTLAGAGEEAGSNDDTAARATPSLPTPPRRQQALAVHTQEARRRRLSGEPVVFSFESGEDGEAFSSGADLRAPPASNSSLSSGKELFNQLHHSASPSFPPSSSSASSPCSLSSASVSELAPRPVPTEGLLSREVLREIWVSQKAFQDEVKARNKTWRDLCASTPTATTAAGSPCVAVGLFGIYEVAAGVPLDSVEAFEDAFDGAQTGNVTLMHYAAAYVPSSFYTPVSLVYDSPLLKRNRKEAVKDGRPPVSNGDTRRENEGDTSEKTRTQEGTETPHTDRGGDTKGLAVDRRMASAQGDRKRTVEAPANVHARQRDGGSHRKVRTPFDFRLASADALLFVYELDSSRGDAADFDAWESAASSWAVSVRKTREERRREKQTVGLFQKAKQREESGSEAEADPTDLREASQRRTARNGRSSDSNGDTGLISLLSQFMPSLASSTSFASTSSFEGGSSSSRFTAGESGVPWSVHAFNSQVASRESVFTVARETPLLLYTFGLVSLFLLLVFGLLGRLSLRVCLLLTLGAHVVTLFSVAGGFCLAHLLWRLPVTPLAPLVLHLLLGFVSQFSLSTLLQLRRARERETKKRDASDQHSLAHQKLQRSQRFQRPLQRQVFESRGFCVSPRHHEEELVSDWMPDQGKFHGTEEFLGESARDVVRFETAGDESPHPCASPLFPTSRNPGCTYAGVEGPRASLVARMSLPLQLPSAALPTSFPAFVRNEARRRSCPSGAREDGCVQETGRLERGSGTSHFRVHALHATSRTPWQQLVLRSDSRLRMLRRVIAASFSGLLLTSLTCVAALLLTSTIDLPAVAFFSQAAASAVVALFFFHIFFFCPLLVRLEQPSLAVGTPESFSGVRTLPPAVPRPLDAREGSGEGRGRGVEKGEAREGAWGRDAEDGEEGRRARGDRQAMPSAATAAEAEEREQSCCLSIGWSTQITGESADTAQFVAGTVRHARGGRSECGLDSHAVGDSDKSVGDRQDTLFREPCCSDGPRESILPIDADLSPLGPEGMPPPQPEGVSIAFKSRPLHVDTTLVFSTSSASRREAVFHASGFDYFHENPNSVSSPRPASYRLCGCGGRGRELGKPGGHPETPLSSRDAASDCVSAGVAPPPAFVSGTVVARPFPEGARTWDESTGKGRDKEYRRESRPGEGSAREIEREAMLHARQAQIVVGAGGEEEVLSEDSDDFFALARDDEEADLGCSQPHFFTDPDGHATRERKIQNRRDMLFSGSGRVSHEASPAHMIEEENTQESRGFQRTCLTPRGSNGGKEEERSEYRTPRSDGTTSGELLVYVHSRREDEGRYREGERTGRSRARDVGRPEDLFADSIHEPREETSSCNAEHRNVPGGSYLEASATPEGDQGEEPRRKKPRRKANKGFRVWDFFTRRRNRRVVLAAFFLLTVTSGLLSRQLGTSFDLLTYLSRDSPLLSFFNAVVFFWPSGLPSKLYLYLPGEDEVQYHDVRQRRKIISFLEELETLHEVQGPILSWITDLEAHVNGTSSATAPGHVPPMITPECPYIPPDSTQPEPFPFDAARFTSRVREWTKDGDDTLCTISSLRQNDTSKTAGEKAPWLQNVIPPRYDSAYIRFSQNDSRIEASRVLLMGLYRPDDPRANVETKRKLETLTKEKLGIEGAFVHADWFEEAERDERIYSMVVKQVLIVTCGLGVFIAFLLSPIGGLLVAGLLLTISLIVASCLVVFGASIDVISLLALFMCVTFTVEYGTHIIYLFLHTGDKHHRVDSRVSSLAWDGEHWRRQSRLPSSKNTTASRRAAIRVWKCARKGLPSIALSATASFLGVFLLTFAHSFAFRAFCLLTGLVLFLSATIAAVVAPVLLYYLEPFLPSVSRQG
ncbi:patched family protein [Toxoplasma gondii GAB2-2007-GAL-DOM2]|uniref:SSD domain-containing protein n=8 Tax=Toxoplasma gondii TaxID=5811 RepID=S7UXK7_TOXGG|nr:hypothetical protein TGGT1_227350 [Toxoplasma gondii GT1]KAF4640760.1 hypothetical protein TGRH88_046860 [Toxoplasma gondii]KFG45156.1 patched family protein [Toxoplasma gondii GAB2-2007-GAL-DOM2]RQX74400.1 patched family protein [Toxoplasma gondii CAST]